MQHHTDIRESHKLEKTVYQEQDEVAPGPECPLSGPKVDHWHTMGISGPKVTVVSQGHSTWSLPEAERRAWLIEQAAGAQRVAGGWGGPVIPAFPLDMTASPLEQHQGEAHDPGRPVQRGGGECGFQGTWGPPLAPTHCWSTLTPYPLPRSNRCLQRSHQTCAATWITGTCATSSRTGKRKTRRQGSALCSESAGLLQPQGTREAPPAPQFGVKQE